MGRGLSPSRVLRLFLLALYTNLAINVAKLGVYRAPTLGGGDTGGVTGCSLTSSILDCTSIN